MSDPCRRHRPRRLKGIRRYPFGGIAKTCAWFWHVAEGRFEDPRDGRGFRLAEPLAAAAYLDPP
jgi:hypothetical protein